MTRIVSRVVVFFLLAYVLSWFGLLGNRLWPSPAWPLPINPLGPLVAAPLTLWLFDGSTAVRDWWRRMLRFRAPLRIYAAAFFIPLALILLAIGLALALGTPSQPLPDIAPGELLILAPLLILFGPLPEEPGFRGMGLHLLMQEMPVLAAAIWIGLGVVIWHLPLFLLGDIPWVVILALFGVSVVYAWLYVAGGSIWPLVLLHWVQNFFGGEWLGTMFTPEHSAVWLTILGVFYLLWASWLVWRYGPSLGAEGARLSPTPT